MKKVDPFSRLELEPDPAVGVRKDSVHEMAGHGNVADVGIEILEIVSRVVDKEMDT